MAGKKPQGPALDPAKVSQFEKSYNPSPDPASLAGKIAQMYSKAVAQKPQPGRVPPIADPSLLSYEHAAESDPHLKGMADAAEAAKQKYMLENGVDENGDPVQKK